MLLIDALYINNGGGKSLLDLLISELNKNNSEVIYLFDNRISGDYAFLDRDRVTFEKASLLKRHLFYLKNKSLITSVLAFGNIPPTFSLKVPVYTYFHNVSFFEKNISLMTRFKAFTIKTLKKNTFRWVVQSDFVRSRLSSSWGISNENILVMPIFNDRIAEGRKKQADRKTGIKFIYISDGHYYKNHKRLIEAFSKYNRDFPDSSLTLTIGDNYSSIKESILNANTAGINIIDKGLIPFNEVLDLLENSSVLIYPSLMESFGLGLIEASLLGLPICASDLPYVFEVVKPNAIFDPLSVDSIYNALLDSRNILNDRSELVCKNEVKNLIKIINN